jgi:hypothetical protein
MKELANSFAELAAIIMILITLAISMAAVAQWFESGETESGDEAESVQIADSGGGL